MARSRLSPSVRSTSRRVAATLVVAFALTIGAVGVLAPVGARAQTQAEGTWALTGSLNVARYDHTTTLLPDGKVLAAAGRLMPVTTPNAALNSAEVYDPISETWSLTGSLADARWRHTATLLADGRVLVAGGFGTPYVPGSNSQPVLATAEIYDPATGTWTPTGSMNTRRGLHVAELLPDGRVLVAGGRTCNEPPPGTCNFTFRTNTAELYDPATGTWTPTGPLVHDRHTTAAALLPTGEVLIPGGFSSEGTGPTSPSPSSPTVDLYNPVTGTSRLTPNLLNPRSRQGAMVLHDGRVLVAAGFEGENTAEVYDRTTETWTYTGPMVREPNRFNHNYAVMPNGKAFVAGGITYPPFPVQLTRSAEVYDPATNQWTSAGDMHATHGSTSGMSNSDEAVVLSANPWTFQFGAACGANCGKVLVAGNNPAGAAELYTPTAPVPTTKDDCKAAGWKAHSTAAYEPFDNQGQCVSYVNATTKKTKKTNK